MVVRISTVLEAITTTIFLHQLYGKRYSLDIKTILFISLHLIIFQGINEEYLPQQFTIMAYLLMIIYCLWEFGGTIKELIINIVLYIVLMGSLQMILVTGLYSFLPKVEMNVLIFMANVIMFFLAIICYYKVQMKKLSYFFQQKDVIIRIILLVCIVIIAGCMFIAKSEMKMYYGQYVVICIFIVILCILAGSWESYKIKVHEKEAELKMYRLYSESFENLLLETRMKQHEFNNHVSAVFSQHLTCSTYDELVKRQKEYFELVMEENRYEKLLVSGNTVLTGFLYGKFLEAEKRNIEVSYNIETTNLNVGMPDYKLIELIGNLLNNAIEALEKTENKKMHMIIQCSEKETVIEVLNASKALSEENIGKIFNCGYSEKGSNRGLGLYNVKNMSREYNFKIIFENKLIDQENWISFSILFKSSPD